MAIVVLSHFLIWIVAQDAVAQNALEGALAHFEEQARVIRAPLRSGTTIC